MYFMGPHVPFAISLICVPFVNYVEVYVPKTCMLLLLDLEAIMMS